MARNRKTIILQTRDADKLSRRTTPLHLLPVHVRAISEVIQTRSLLCNPWILREDQSTDKRFVRQKLATSELHRAVMLLSGIRVRRYKTFRWQLKNHLSFHKFSIDTVAFAGGIHLGRGHCVRTF